jgi:BirA family biotin operon repressor/biotin-[acetyl-CoA-carboxylase] ligase
MPYRRLSQSAIAKNLNTRVVGREVVVLKTVGSTNDWLKAAAAEGAAEGLVVFAEEQTAGRGQQGRAWQAPPGCCLLGSILLRPDLAPDRLPYLTMVGSCAAAGAIIGRTSLPIVLKWPNDVMGERGKVGGVLTEASLTDGGLEYAILGIGINVNLPCRDLATIPGADSLRADLGRDVNRNALAHDLLQALDERYGLVKDGDFGAILGEWKERLRTPGQWVTLRRGDAVDGLYFARGVADNGALILLREDGSTFEVVAGEVSVRPSPDTGKS